MKGLEFLIRNEHGELLYKNFGDTADFSLYWSIVLKGPHNYTNSNKVNDFHAPLFYESEW